MRMPCPTRRHARGKATLSQQHRAAALLTPVLVTGLILASGAPALADQPAKQTYAAGTYFVQLADQPVATDPSTAPAPGTRLDTATDAVRDHVRKLKRERDKVLDAVDGVKPLYSYQLLVNGFAAKLTAYQANALARTPGVVSLSRNVMSHPTASTGTSDDTATATGATLTKATATTSAALPPVDSPAYLGLKSPGGLYSKIPGGQANAGAGTILGVIDTGIDMPKGAAPNPSLKPLSEPRPDAAVIAKKWKGSCDPGADTAHQVECNNKVIGAQYFNKSVTDPKDTDWASPLDGESHGTHTATTAAGDANVDAAVPDSGISGKISGLAPAARIAAYRVCYSAGCGTIDIVAALEKAVADGVDVINYSLGGSNTESAGRPEYLAMLNAAKAGVFISASAGNSGPRTASNGVPWVTTVAASTHSTGYRATLTLGNGKSYTGVSISGSAAPSAPLVDAAQAVKSGADAAQAALCMPDTLDPAKVKGAIVVCARGGNARTDKSAQVKALGGVGMALYNTNAADEEVADGHTVPSVHLDKASGEAVKAYAVTAGATAQLAAAVAVKQRSPQMAAFSSSGPDLNSTGDLLKPDITAPGVDIVAGTAPGTPGFSGSQGIMSGTSMSAPHVSGLALLVRQLHPKWSPMAVKSALMTTATPKDDTGKAIQRSGADATPLDYGSGHVVPNSAVDPGLVYDSSAADWVSYLCAIGQAPVNDDGSDSCRGVKKTDASDLNTPNIAVGDLTGTQTVTRTVTNVTAKTAVYTASVQAPAGYKATVTPAKLTVKPGAKASYKVAFTRTTAPFGQFAFGAVTWSDKQHKVRSTIALRATRVTAPAELRATGTTGKAALAPRSGFSGTFATSVNGLYAGTTKTGTLTGSGDFDPTKSTPRTAKFSLTVPAGLSLARVAILPSDFKSGSDIDLWVLDKDGNPLTNPGAGSDEHLDLAAGSYTVYVSQYTAPKGTDTQKYTVHTWLIGKTSKPAPKASVNPVNQKVTAGAAAKSTVSWSGLKKGQTYVGLVSYGEAKKAADARTTLTVVP